MVIHICRLLEPESKHGRVAMLASVGRIATHPGTSIPIKNKSHDVPAYYCGGSEATPLQEESEDK